MIRFVQQNFVHGTEEVLNKLRNDDNLGNEIEIETLGEALDTPYAYVENKMIKGDSPEELYNKIKKNLY